MDHVFFVEVQRFRQLWVWVAVLVSTAPLLVLAALGVLPRPAATALLVSTLLIPVLVALCSLTVEVRGEVIAIRFFPFQTAEQIIPLRDVTSHAARRYDPLREYGGWGIRGLGANRAYNVSGDRGVQLVLSDGRRILVGSQRADQLDAAITRAEATRR